MTKEKKGTEEENLIKKTSLKERIIGKRYLSYTNRLVLYTIFSVLFVIICIVSFAGSISYNEEESTKYSETSYLDYKVYLKPNEFYESEYLGKNMLYIASLIDNINVDFNYTFFIEDFVDLDFSYDIVGKLTIADETGNSIFFEKEYILKESVSQQLSDASNYSIKDNITIDYDYYNQLANDFKTAYGVDATSNLNVYLRINKKVSEDVDNIRLNDSSVMSITIPLSQKAININMNYTEINDSNYITSASELVMSNYVYVVISVVSFGIAIVSLSKCLKLLFAIKKKKSAYDKFVSKMLTEYDRLIVETTTNPKLDKHSIIKVKKFEELLDVRDNIKLPIMYYSVTEHQKCYFYIKFHREVYLYVVKAVDLEENNEKVR